MCTLYSVVVVFSVLTDLNITLQYIEFTKCRSIVKNGACNRIALGVCSFEMRKTLKVSFLNALTRLDGRKNNTPEI